MSKVNESGKSCAKNKKPEKVHSEWGCYYVRSWVSLFVQSFAYQNEETPRLQKYPFVSSNFEAHLQEYEKYQTTF
jgi:hypothetical protein